MGVFSDACSGYHENQKGQLCWEYPLLALVIDSSADSRRALQENLRALGLETLEAARTRTALLALKAAVSPDVVFYRPDSSVSASSVPQTLHVLNSHRGLPVIALGDPQTLQESSIEFPRNACLIAPDNRDSVAAALVEAGLKLPVPVAQVTPRPSVKPIGESAGDAVSVLVVDPAAFVRQLLSKVLRESPGFELAATAQDGAAALEKIERLKPDIVTLDLVMSGMDGFETIEEIRHRWPDLPIVVFSAVHQKADEVKRMCLKRGANDYVAKPDTMPDLGAAVTWLQQNLLQCLSQFFPDRLGRSAKASQLENSSDDTVRFGADTQVIESGKKKKRGRGK